MWAIRFNIYGLWTITNSWSSPFNINEKRFLTVSFFFFFTFWTAVGSAGRRTAVTLLSSLSRWRLAVTNPDPGASSLSACTQRPVPEDETQVLQLFSGLGGNGVHQKQYSRCGMSPRCSAAVVSSSSPRAVYTNSTRNHIIIRV